MKKAISVWMSGTALALAMFVSACNSDAEKDRKELARAEEEAIKTANKATDEVVNGADTNDMIDSKEKLREAEQKLNEKQQNYLISLKKTENKIHERLAKVDEKIKSADGNARKRFEEKRDKLVKERDMLQANILEIQKPMDDDQFQTVQKQVDGLISTIDKELEGELN